MSQVMMARCTPHMIADAACAHSTSRGKGDVDAKLYLMIAAIVAIVFALGFTLIPEYSVAPYGAPSEPYLIFAVRILGLMFLALGVITWLARDFQNWTR